MNNSIFPPLKCLIVYLIFQQIVDHFPGKLIDLDLPKLPVVDGKKLAARIFGDNCNHSKEDKNICEIIYCLQKQVHSKRVRCQEFLEGFDFLHTGTVTINQFERGLHNMGVGKYLTQREFRLLCARYLDPMDTNRIMWRRFADEIDQGKTQMLCCICRQSFILILFFIQFLQLKI